MPTRSFYFPPDFAHVEAILIDAHGEQYASEIRKFRYLNRPALIDDASLVYILGISPSIVHSITRFPKNHYREFKIRKKGGGVRRICAPRTYLKVIQWWINDNILASYQPPKYVFGFVRGRGIIDNARFHFGATRILNVDIKDYFPSIQQQDVVSAFEKLGYTSEVSLQLARLCTYQMALPQGAPTSPSLANIVFEERDQILQELANRHGLRYSRYADDLTFSGSEVIPINFLRKLEKTIKSFGFRLNKKKTRFAGPGNRQDVTGFVINKKIQPTRAWRKNTRAKIHQIGMKERLAKEDIEYLYGIKGICNMLEKGTGMDSIWKEVKKLLEGQN